LKYGHRLIIDTILYVLVPGRPATVARPAQGRFPWAGSATAER
jgi:hypothetical protein